MTVPLPSPYATLNAPLEPFLRDPGAVLRHLLQHLQALASAYGLLAGITLAGALALAEGADAAPPLGLKDLAHIAPAPYTVKFIPGDQMLLFTDGIIEARDRHGCFYPLIERGDLLRSVDPQQGLERLRADVLEHVGGPLSDDAAMLLIRRRTTA